MAENIHRATAEITRMVTLETAEPVPGVIVFRQTVSTRVDNMEGDYTPAPGVIGPRGKKVTEGVTDASGLERMLRGENIRPRELFAIVPAMLEKLRTDGWPTYGPDSEWEEGEFESGIRRNVFTALMDEGLDVDSLCRLDTSSHMVFDRNEIPVPVAVTFDYTNGRCSEERFDVPKAVAHLLEREDAYVFAMDRLRGRPEREGQEAANAEEAIGTIPYYQDNAGLPCFAFRWQPSTEAYLAAWQRALEMGGEYPSVHMHSVIMELDLIGLQEAGAVKGVPAE